MESYVFDTNEISANSFENLMKKLKIETDPKQRSILSGSLTKTLLQPNGFIAYYEYLSSVSEDSHECIQLFCKVVLTRPSTFLNNAEYLYCNTRNFADIIELLFNAEDDQNLRTLLSKLFYFLRRDQDLEHFDFFFEALVSKSGEIDLLLFDKLCSWDFYTDELYDNFYEKVFEKIISVYLELDSTSGTLKRTIRSGSTVIKFESLCSLFEKIGITNIKKVLALWENGQAPSHFIKAALIASLSDNSFIDSLKTEASGVDIDKDFDSLPHNILCKSPEHLSGNTKIVSSEMSEIDEIMTNLKSFCPTDKAYGLHRLRQVPRSGFDLSCKLLEAVMSCLFDDDSFVYMNGIKTFITLGKSNPSLVCRVLFETADLRINENDHSTLNRFIEIFDELILTSESTASKSTWTGKFVLLCSKYIQSSMIELRCSIINYYIDVLNRDFNSFIINQAAIWEGFNVFSKIPPESDLESEGTFKLIDTYISVIINEGRHLADDKLLCNLDNFLRKAIASGSSQTVLMARNNLIELERIIQID